MKTLVIAEKPSVANDIAKALGSFEKKDEYFESEAYVVTSAVGHLLEITPPEGVEVTRGKWSFAHLPVLPPEFDLRPIVKTEARLKVLQRLLKRKDVDCVINACDAGREGELIFRYIVQYAKARHAIKRLWLQSMTPQAIRNGFAQLRTDAEMLTLADAARCRSEADWLIGINSTRAMTAFNSKEGGFFLTTVGRVQTPTLSIVVAREERIRQFKTRQYFEVHADFAAQKGQYPARWIDPNFVKDELDAALRADRLWDSAQAQAIVQRCQGQAGIVTEETKPMSKGSPLLFDLTSLQREANGRFGFSAKTTLSIAQALYERHKVLTYPRTDSRYLPEDYVATTREVVAALGQQAGYRRFAEKIQKQEWIKPTKKIFNNQKVSDHFAIIPTSIAPTKLSEVEQKLYDFVVKRFLSVFYPASEYLQTVRTTMIASDQFRSEGKVLLNPGWLEVYGKEADADDDENGTQLIPITAGETVQTQQIESRGLFTKPPPRLTEATLLTAMETAGKLVEDEELSSALSEKGLGTPATRAAIIEGLLTEQYLLREGRELVPTAKAFQLVILLRGLDIPELTEPELTGAWEHKLALMEKGKISRDEFMRDIHQMTSKIVNQAKAHTDNSISGDYATLQTPCPACGQTVRENYRRFACSACSFSISKYPAGRNFELAEVEQFLSAGKLGPLQGFRSKMGRPFAATLLLTKGEDQIPKLEFDFGQDRGDATGVPPDLSQAEVVAACPKCQHKVYDLGLSYACEKQLEKACDFRSGKIILQQEIVPAQMKKLLTEGRTDLLTGFVSQRTRRAFKAYLVRAEDGKISFAFEPKGEGKAPRAGKAAAKKTTSATSKAKSKPSATARTATKATTKASPVKAAKKAAAPVAKRAVAKKSS